MKLHFEIQKKNGSIYMKSYVKKIKERSILKEDIANIWKEFSMICFSFFSLSKALLFLLL